MELRTYTSLWSVEGRIYGFGDINLPRPVSYRQLGTLLASTVVWIGLMNLVHMPFHTPFHVLWVAPPALFTWWANKPIAEGKTIVQFCSAQVLYWLSPKSLTDLSPETKQSAEMQVTGNVWSAG